MNDVSPNGTLPPGTDLTYTITFTNSGSINVHNFFLIDPTPNDCDFKLGSATINLGTTGLTAAISYSNDGGLTYAYTPISGGGGAPGGYDRSVTHIKWTFTGTLSNAAPNNTGTTGFTARIR